MPIESSWLSGRGNTSQQDSAPIKTDLLCHRCGYILKGLSPIGRCPECGEPIGGRRRAQTAHIRFSERSPSMFRRVRIAAWLSLLAWLGGVTAWLDASYYVDVGILQFVGPAVVSLCAILVALHLTTGDLQFVHPDATHASKFNRLLRFASIAAPILTAIAMILHYRFSVPAIVIILLTWLTVWAWTLVQVLVCIVFARVAAEAEDDALAHLLHRIAKALTIVVVLMSPVQAMMQWMSVRMGGMPIFCLPCYLLPLAFLFGQVANGWCMMRISRLMTWALAYQASRDTRDRQLRERINEPGQVPVTSTRLERD